MNPGELIRQRRIELGITPREVARRAGVHASVLRNVEASGSVEALSVRQLRAIESVTGVSVAQLLRSTSEQVTESAGSDSAALGALLLKRQHEFGLTPPTIARSFGWDLRRFELAKEALSIQLLSSGGKIVEGEDGALEIVNAQSSEVALAEELIFEQPEAFELDDDQLSILLDVADCHDFRIFRLYSEYSERDRRRIADLVAVGILETNGDCVELSPRSVVSMEPIMGFKRASQSFTLESDLRSSRRSSN